MESPRRHPALAPLPPRASGGADLVSVGDFDCAQWSVMVGFALYLGGS